MPASWLNYHHLYYFRAIATEGSIARAAKKLRLGQPTLSMQLKQLEDALGRKLFDREKKRLVLTEAGQMALDYANEIFRLGDEMVDAVHDRLTPGRISIQVGSEDAVPKHVTTQMLQAALTGESCTVSVIEGRVEELLRELKAHRIDLMLATERPPSTEAQGLRARLVAKMPVVVCGAAKFAALKKGFPKSLDGQPFVMPSPTSRLRHDLDHFLAVHAIRPDVVAEAQDTSLQLLLGSHALGLVAVAEPAAAELVKAKALVRLGELENIHEELWIVSGQRRIDNPVAARLMRDFQLS